MWGGSPNQLLGQGSTSSAPSFAANPFGSRPTRVTASAFGTPIASSFGASSSPAVEVSGTSRFDFSSSPTFGQSSSMFGRTPFGSTNTAFGAQNSTFGTRVANYTRTTETENGGLLPGNLESISAMPLYKDKSHEELRWEDYHLGDKGGPAPPGQSSGGIGSNTNSPLSNALSTSSQFGQTVAYSVKITLLLETHLLLSLLPHPILSLLKQHSRLEF